jgi:K+-sensing histidine kinase KdpD
MAPANYKLLEFISSQLDKRELMKSSTLREDFLAFYHAITWSDKGFFILLFFHLLIVSLAICLRRNTDASIALFVLICATVLVASYINSFLANRWKSTGLFTQNYFDERGNFISLFFSAPLLLIVFGQMIYSLVVASSLLIKVKRAELQRNRAAATTTTTNTTNNTSETNESETLTSSKSSTLHRRRNSAISK